MKLQETKENKSDNILTTRLPFVTNVAKSSPIF